MLYEIIKDNNKLKYAQKHSRNKIRAVNLIFCSTNDNKLRGNKDSVINIIKEFFDKGEIEIQENVLQMRAEMPEEILSIFIESHIYNVDDKSIKVTSKPIFNKKHPVWAEDLIKLLKLEY
jgi:hypothetical protein